MKFCERCSYPMIESRELNPPGGVRASQCSNPYHPRRESCPKCLANGLQEVATIGGANASVRCLHCRHVWKPEFL